MHTAIGARLKNTTTTFTVWAPEKEKMILHLTAPEEKYIEMTPEAYGYFHVTMDSIPSGTRYFFRPDDKNDFPDPASFFQPDGVHESSEVIDHFSFKWTDEKWKNIPFDDLIIYELHVGTFTKEGTFDAIIPLLDDLIEIGINTIELMPVMQFPGERNWGYDGVYSYAVQNSYGGPDALKRLINECHNKGIAVFLDVVYNHLGPEGNYFAEFGPYFTDKYSTPWGKAMNFDGKWSDGVREYFCNNAIYWLEYFHIDGLRLDAIHTIFDDGAFNFWDYLNKQVRTLENSTGRNFYLVAESDLNSPRVVKQTSSGGYGFTAQWLDDFHHALYTLLDPAGRKRYEDYGTMEQLIKAYKEGFVLSGDWVNFRKRKYGASSAGVDGNRFIIFNQNHDQVGNRILGERLCMLVDHEKVKLAAAAIILSPYIPMLFMGEEYADDTPFYYFVSHSEENLLKAVREGRKKEFRNFGDEGNPPDPDDKLTFESSKLKWNKRFEPGHKIILEWHKQLIQIRRNISVFKNFNKKDIELTAIGQEGFLMRYSSANKKQEILCMYNLSGHDLVCQIPATHSYQKLLYSKDTQWLGETHPPFAPVPNVIDASKALTLPPFSVCVYLNIQ